MVALWRRYSWKSKFILLLMVYTLGMSVLGNMTVFRRLGEVDIQTWLYWDPGHQCYRVSPLSSLEWGPMASGSLHVGDCLVSVDGIPLRDTDVVASHLQRVYARVEGLRNVIVTGYRNGEIFQVRLPLVRWTLHDILKAQLLIEIPGLILWLIGVLVFLAQPNSSANQSLSAFLLLAGMLLMGINHWFENYTVNVIFELGVDILPRAILAILIFKLALEFPIPAQEGRWRRWAMVPFVGIAVWAVVAHSLALLSPNLPNVHRVYLQKSANILLAGSFLVAVFFFAARSWYLQRRYASPKIRQQGITLVLALFTGIPLVVLDALTYISGHSWPFIRFSHLTTVGWIIPGAAMLAYAMLRYQAFAYRGQFLSVLLIFFISATIVQIYSMFILLGQVDGVEWVMLWGGVLITTALFYIDSPLRRSFIRYFSRHAHDYEIVTQFSRRIDPYQELKTLVSESVVMLCRDLEVDWVCCWTSLLPERLFVARAGEQGPEEIAITGMPTPRQCPTPPVHEEWLEEGDDRLGVIWFGPRTTAEPFDKEDQRLAHLLALELARVIALRSYIVQLEETPGLILAAIDQERRRIGQDIHDGVLQFLGVLPLSLDRAKRLWKKEPAKAESILDGLVDQSQRVTEDARNMAYALSLPGIRQGSLLTMAYQYASAVCHSAGIELIWDVRHVSAWMNVREDAAVHVFRILQEGIHNAVRHGDPMFITVQWSVEDGMYMLEIVDDGRGMDVSHSSSQIGLGLVSMRERARVLKGTLVITSSPTGGTVLQLSFPIQHDLD